jgi:hypothetical protein
MTWGVRLLNRFRIAGERYQYLVWGTLDQRLRLR